MAQRCPDCDSVVVMSVPERGNGKCRHCHGTSSVHELHTTFTGRRERCHYCNGTGQCQTCGGHGVVEQAQRPHANAELNPLDDKIAVKMLCPKCGEIDWFEWKFLGKLTDPICGHSWYVGSGIYTLQQLRAVYQSGRKVTSYLNRGVHAKNPAEWFMKLVMGGFGGMVIGIAFRLPYAILLIPIQALVRISNERGQTARQTNQKMYSDERGSNPDSSTLDGGKTTPPGYPCMPPGITSLRENALDQDTPAFNSESSCRESSPGSTQVVTPSPDESNELKPLTTCVDVPRGAPSPSFSPVAGPQPSTSIEPSKRTKKVGVYAVFGMAVLVLTLSGTWYLRQRVNPVSPRDLPSPVTVQSLPTNTQGAAILQNSETSSSSVTYTAGVRPSFDCSKASTRVERLICHDGRLASLEVEMASSFRQALNRLPQDAQLSLRREHLAWFKNYSRTCNHSPDDGLRAACVANFLSQHTAELKAWPQ